MIKNKEILKTLFKVGIVINLLAIFDLPYGFYSILRIFNTLIFASRMVEQYEKSHKKSFVASLLLVIIFNPFEKIVLEKETWIFIDIAAAVYYIVMLNQQCPIRFKNNPQEMSEYQREIHRLKK